ncbi:hypothetical protein KAU32_10270 [bacterium]|nr:hypothetical protein [bacterium]
MHCNICQTPLFDKKAFTNQSHKKYVKCPECGNVFKIQTPKEIRMLFLFVIAGIVIWIYKGEHNLSHAAMKIFSGVVFSNVLSFAVAPLMASYDFSRLELIHIDDPSDISASKYFNFKKKKKSKGN